MGHLIPNRQDCDSYFFYVFLFKKNIKTVDTNFQIVLQIILLIITKNVNN